MKKYKVNFTITYDVDEESVIENIKNDFNFIKEEEITEALKEDTAISIARNWLAEAIEETQIDSSDEYFSVVCDVINQKKDYLNLSLFIRDKAFADKLLNEYARSISIEKSISIEDAITIAKSNIGYNAANYSNKNREEVENLFDCEHPYFGKYSVNGSPTPSEALYCGIYNIALIEYRNNSHLYPNIK